MQWWNEFVTWLQTIDGHRSIFLGAVVLVSVVVGVLVTAAVVRGSIKRLIAQQQREQKNNVIATLVDAAAEAASWNTLPASVQVQSDRACAQAETLLRLLPVKGSGVAANWAAHELEALKRASPTTIGAAPASITEFRDRLIAWRNKPARAKKTFITDLERWSYLDTASPEADPAVAIAAVAPDVVTAKQPATAPGGTDTADKAGASAVVEPTASDPTPVTEASNDATPIQPTRMEPTPMEPTPIKETPVSETTASHDVAYPAASEAPAQATAEAPVTPERSPIALATPPRRATTDETERLLADVDALEVRNAPRPVEEFAPVPASTSPSAASQRTERGPEPHGTL